MAPAGGVLVIDKPRGPTSHDVVARVRRALGLRAVGHAGTLDPMATGVLVVAVGEATKLVPWLTAQDKTYETTIALGVETDTLDAEGREVRRVAPSPELLHELAAAREGRAAPALHAALERERTRTSQVPPAFSAIRTEGERSFVRARRGEATELPAREVKVNRLELVECRADPPLLVLRLEVGKGYYVRSLARDLAEALGTAGHLTDLRRTSSGHFSLEEAVPLDGPAGELAAGVQPLARAAARALPVARLSVAGARDARHGRRVAGEELDPRTPGPRAWLDPEGDLVAVGELGEDGYGRVLRGFVTA